MSRGASRGGSALLAALIGTAIVAFAALHAALLAFAATLLALLLVAAARSALLVLAALRAAGALLARAAALLALLPVAVRRLLADVALLLGASLTWLHLGTHFSGHSLNAGPQRGRLTGNVRAGVAVPADLADGSGKRRRTGVAGRLRELSAAL